MANRTKFQKLARARRSSPLLSACGAPASIGAHSG